ncbi:MAG: ATP-binding protein, partial [candidate division Zixibacteria bacterium]|nr:ATP-binding protein [candidate division Zixibacteria bacterium]
MFKTPIKESVSEYLASIDSLDGIRRAARTALNETRMPERDVDRIILALEEAATNVIRHSYSDTTSGKICLKVTRYTKRIVLSLVDYGKPYFPEEKVEISLDKLVQTSRRGGLGRLMIQRLMDDVEYIVGDNFNELRMTKFIDKKWRQSANMPNRAFGLRARFSVATIGILVAITLGAYAVMESKTITAIEARLNRTMNSLGNSCANLAETFILNGRSSVEFDELARSYANQSEDLERVTIVSADGKIMADTDNIRLLRKQYQPPDGIDLTTLGANQIFETPDDKRFLRLPIGRAGRHLGDVYMVYNTHSVSGEIAGARESILLFVFFALLAGLVSIYFLSNYFVRPILSLIDRVRLFSERSEVADLPMSGAQEFFEISKALNQMMTRLRRDNVALVERERFMREAKFASEIQETLLPKKAPEAPGLDLGAHYRAASFVGGDLYDFFPT